jgi:hypothetical protein
VADPDEVPILEGPAEPPVLEEAEAPEAPPAAGPTGEVANAGPPPAPPAPRQSGPKAPNFIGLSMRSVVALAQAQGLPVVLAGTGIVRAQVPPPGAVLHGGERIRVDLAR